MVQVVLAATLRHKETQQELAVVTTHLKARRGALLSTLRAEQGADLLQWLASVLPRPATPLVLTGDLTAPPSEAVVAGVLTRGSRLPLTSAYPLDTLGWSTWKVSCDWRAAGHVTPTLTLIGGQVRDTGEEKHVLDYILHSPASVRTLAVLDPPPPEAVGEARLPSLQFPSDHLSLVADLAIL